MFVHERVSPEVARRSLMSRSKDFQRTDVTLFFLSPRSLRTRLNLHLYLLSSFESEKMMMLPSKSIARLCSPLFVGQWRSFHGSLATAGSKITSLSADPAMRDYKVRADIFLNKWARVV